MKVVFRKFKDNGDIIAFFPEQNWKNGCCNFGNIMSYMHIGQHSESNYFELLSVTVPAKISEFEDLAKEICSIYQESIKICYRIGSKLK